MKKISLIIFLALAAVQSWALPVDVNSAANRASALLQKDVAQCTGIYNNVRARVPSVSAHEPAFYLFNAEDGKGFVIVSGDDEMPEIVAYSKECSFNSDNMSPSLVGYLENYTSMVEAVRAGDASVVKAPAKASATPVVSPLCKVSWGQEAPYYNNCPSIDGTHCPVGCVATAMAQIMYHFAWPKVGTGSKSYASGISGIGVIGSNFAEHSYDWNAMCSKTDDNLASETASAAVAQISYDCGIGSEMTYAADGSGTNDDLAMKAMYTYFSYRASLLRRFRRECYATQEEWNNLIKNELDNNRPVLYGGFTTSSAGHEFIIDGYDTDDFFHVNWGWDGTSNGFYSIVTLRPKNSAYSFSEGQTAVCGIEPDESGVDKTPQQFRIYMQGSPEVSADSAKCGTSFRLNLGTAWNYSRTAGTWMFGAALYSADGVMDTLITRKVTSNKIQILAYHGEQNKTLQATIPADQPDGFYYICCVFRQQVYSDAEQTQLIYKDFVLPDMVGGTELNRIPVIIKGGVAYFNQVPTAIEQISAQGAAVVSTDYFTIDGRKTSSSTKGILIKRQHMSDGSVTSSKMYIGN